MKKLLLLTISGVLGTSLALFGQAQSATPSADQAKTTTQAGARHAWGDKNKDGICDVTGNPVGQGQRDRQAMAGRRGQGRHGRQASARGRGWCCQQTGAFKTPVATPAK